MANHVDIVIGVLSDPEPDTLLRDFKSYASRRLNDLAGRPPSGTWWTESGSRRKLPDEAAVHAAVAYVETQPVPLLVWSVESARRSGRPGTETSRRHGLSG
jgi:hypothetical protein